MHLKPPVLHASKMFGWAHQIRFLPATATLPSNRRVQRSLLSLRRDNELESIGPRPLPHVRHPKFYVPKCPPPGTQQTQPWFRDREPIARRDAKLFLPSSFPKR